MESKTENDLSSYHKNVTSQDFQQTWKIINIRKLQTKTITGINLAWYKIANSLTCTYFQPNLHFEDFANAIFGWIYRDSFLGDEMYHQQCLASLPDVLDHISTNRIWLKISWWCEGKSLKSVSPKGDEWYSMHCAVVMNSSFPIFYTTKLTTYFVYCFTLPMSSLKMGKSTLTDSVNADLITIAHRAIKAPLGKSQWLKKQKQKNKTKHKPSQVCHCISEHKYFQAPKNNKMPISIPEDWWNTGKIRKMGKQEDQIPWRYSIVKIQRWINIVIVVLSVSHPAL